MPTTFLKVIDVEILTLATRDGIPDQRTSPLLRFELEDGSEFMMSGIPSDIAINLSIEINDVQLNDSRMKIHNLVGELSVVEKVEIDVVVPETQVYQATIYVIPEGFERSLQYQMVPSHATLLAVINNADIFVSEALVRQAENMRNA